ncbi:hypothetical protein [Streptomyces sp. NPDC101776]|uniref:hypothetical protein n=1 Tax=Streptomyces sp. NPDC101776 TaxID=3366146 RepID=UPI0037F56849
MPPRSPSPTTAPSPPRPSPAVEGCAMAILMPVEVIFGLMSSVIVGMGGSILAASAWLGVLIVAALAAGVSFFRRGYSISGSAQALTAAVFLGLMVTILGYR